jgi:alginate O-acetyltransferase complex protein AlgI
LYLILPISVIGYHFLREVWQKNLALIVISLILYTLGQPAYLLVMGGLSFLNYRLALRIDPENRNTLLILVFLNLVVLACYKYMSLILDLFHVNVGDFRVFPLGLSIFAFSAISYVIDVYNGTVEPEEDFGHLLLYFLMFPKLLQGPIVPYSDMRAQLSSRRSTPRSVFEGFQRFLFGLAKKLLLADSCGRLLESLNRSGGDNTLVGVWFAAILFLFQIYYDFSGCCDMAIGLGRMFGFRYGENFNRPYMALSVTNFCKGWNMSLGSFFSKYVYEPLGGEELGQGRQAINVMICCLLVGLWHSTGLNYLIWGAFLGAVLIAEMYLNDSMRFWPDWLCRCWTLWLVTFGFILFSHEDLAQLQSAMKAILGFGGFAVPGTGRAIISSLPLLAVCTLGCTNLPVLTKRIFAGICGMDRRGSRNAAITPMGILYSLVCLLVVLALLWLCTVALTAQNPLMPIYAKF